VYTSWCLDQAHVQHTSKHDSSVNSNFAFFNHHVICVYQVFQLHLLCALLCGAFCYLLATAVYVTRYYKHTVVVFIQVQLATTLQPYYHCILTSFGNVNYLVNITLYCKYDTIKHTALHTCVLAKLVPSLFTELMLCILVAISY
jgi:hypothetical protein